MKLCRYLAWVHFNLNLLQSLIQINHLPTPLSLRLIQQNDRPSHRITLKILQRRNHRNVLTFWYQRQRYTSCSIQVTLMHLPWLRVWKASDMRLTKSKSVKWSTFSTKTIKRKAWSLERRSRNSCQPDWITGIRKRTWNRHLTSTTKTAGAR